MYQINQKLVKAIDKYFMLCKEHSDYITEHPELGLQEELACARYVEVLSANGYLVETPIGGVPHSFLAVDKNRIDDSLPKAVLMCEYDALPEIGHGCGHSMSGSASLLAGLALKEAFSDLPIRIDIMGTPGEENPGAKELLVKAGAFDGYEFAAMAHMADFNANGFRVLACNDRYITFHGVAAHASSMPERGINALNAARLFMDAMDMWRQHLPKFSQLHGVVVKGGDAPNTVPDNVELEYYFRARTKKELDDLSEKAATCAKGAALCTGCTYNIEQRFLENADLSNPPAAMEIFQEIFDALGETTRPMGDPGGSSDAGNVDQVIPTLHPLVCVTGGALANCHSKEFTGYMKSETGYKALHNAAVLLASFILQLAEKPEKLEEIKHWHKIYRMG